MLKQSSLAAIDKVYNSVTDFLIETENEVLAEKIKSRYTTMNERNIARHDWPPNWPRPCPPFEMFLELIKTLQELIDQP